MYVEPDIAASATRTACTAGSEGGHRPLACAKSSANGGNPRAVLREAASVRSTMAASRAAPACAVAWVRAAYQQGGGSLASRVAEA